MHSKIFCIGLNKTGTTSLHDAFTILGLQSVHQIEEDGTKIKQVIAQNHKNGNMLLKGLEKYDAYTDWNYPKTNKLFRVFYEQYPNSKFILSTREIDSWILSREKHVLRTPYLEVKRKEKPQSAWFNIDKTQWKIEYYEHHRDVYDFFQDKEGALLVIDIIKGDGWEKICRFLDYETPKVPFPKSNTADVIG